MTQGFALKLKNFRIGAEISQNALAKAVGVSPSYINKIEKGEREAPKRDVVLAIAQVLSLKDFERDELLLSADYAPEIAERVDLADPTLRLMAEIWDDNELDFDDSVERLTRLLKQKRKNNN